MPVSLPKETVKMLAELYITSIISKGKKDKSPEELSKEIMNVLDKELHFDVVETPEKK